ncbi:MAG: GNAT family N-acetyltransferase [Legionellales bacterium]|nr:GNAT family N-acetyltransferase [Legionellales bacterium]
MKIRMLTQEDSQPWKLLRLEALKNLPESFGSSYEEEVNWPDLDFQNSLTKSDIFGVFVDNSLVSCAGFYSLNSAKTKHRGVIWGMYTRPECKGQGIASALIQTIINHAKSLVTQLHLTCVTSNIGAVAFYQKHGFKIYVTEPRALKMGENAVIIAQAFNNGNLNMAEISDIPYARLYEKVSLLHYRDG